MPGVCPGGHRSSISHCVLPALALCQFTSLVFTLLDVLLPVHRLVPALQPEQLVLATLRLGWEAALHLMGPSLDVVAHVHACTWGLHVLLCVHLACAHSELPLCPDFTALVLAPP